MNAENVDFGCSKSDKCQFSDPNLDNFYRSFTVHLERFTVDSD